MPFVKIEVTREGVTREQKRQLKKVWLMWSPHVLNKDPNLTHISIQEVDTDNWGHAGEQVSVLREQGISADKKMKIMKMQTIIITGASSGIGKE